MFNFINANLTLKLIGLSFVAGLLSACAVGNTYDYQTQEPAFDIISAKEIAVGVLDQRPYIITGNKESNFIGLQRGGFAVPYNVTTKSGEPLANDISTAIVNGMDASKINAKTYMLMPGNDRKAARKNVLSSGSTRSLLIYLNEWKTDTYKNVALIYNVEAEVVGANGETIAKNNAVGRENLGGDFINPMAYATKHVPIAFSRVFGKLLNEQSIIDALK